jgi:hypothetical protein
MLEVSLDKKMFLLKWIRLKIFSVLFDRLDNFKSPSKII